MTNRIWVATIAIGLMLSMPARAQSIIRCTKTLDGLNEYITSLREARDDYLTSRNQALRLLPRRGSLNTTEALEYNNAMLNVESKRMYVESASIAVVDWISSARQYSCASGSDLDRVEREISNIFLVVKDGERTPLPKRAF